MINRLGAHEFFIAATVPAPSIASIKCTLAQYIPEASVFIYQCGILSVMYCMIPDNIWHPISGDHDMYDLRKGRCMSLDFVLKCVLPLHLMYGVDDR